MLASAGETPSPVDAIAAVERLGMPARGEGAGDDHVGSVGVEAIEMLAGEERQQHRGFGPDHHDPSGGAVGGGDRFDDFHAGREIHIEAAVTFRHEHAEASGGGELREQIEREAAGGVYFGAALADGRREIANRIEDGLRFRSHRVSV